jgi:hypothetical protein
MDIESATEWAAGMWGIQDAAKARPPRYKCSVCNRYYDTLEKAEECARTPMYWAHLEPGDIVLIPSKWRYSQHDEHSPWVACTIPADPTERSHFDHVDQTMCWFVVTSKHDYPGGGHTGVYSVLTLGWEKFIQCGWTNAYFKHHCWCWDPTRPDEHPHEYYWQNPERRYWEHLKDLRVPDVVREQGQQFLGLRFDNLL